MREFDEDDIQMLNKIPIEVIAGGVKELQETVFRIRRWVSAATKTIEDLQKMGREMDDGPDKDVIEKALGDLLEAGLIMIKVAERDGRMAEVAEKAKEVVEGRSLVTSIEEFLNKKGDK